VVAFVATWIISHNGVFFIIALALVVPISPIIPFLTWFTVILPAIAIPGIGPFAYLVTFAVASWVNAALVRKLWEAYANRRFAGSDVPVDLPTPGVPADT
jgi:hypothetical protein